MAVGKTFAAQSLHQMRLDERLVFLKPIQCLAIGIGYRLHGSHSTAGCHQRLDDLGSRFQHLTQEMPGDATAESGQQIEDEPSIGQWNLFPLEDCRRLHKLGSRVELLCGHDRQLGLGY